MEDSRFDKWLHRLRVTATIVYIVALCLAVAVLVIAFIPHSPVTAALPATDVPGLDHLSGLAAGVTVDPAGTIAVELAEPSVVQRLLYLVVVLPGLALVALIAWRMAKLLRATLASDPFTAQTVRALTALAKITAVGGIAVWAMSNLAPGCCRQRSSTRPHPSHARRPRWRGSPLRSSSPRSVNSSPAESRESGTRRGHLVTDRSTTASKFTSTTSSQTEASPWSSSPAQVGVTVANLSILKNGHARAVRFSTLTAICDTLDCQPGQLLSLQSSTHPTRPNTPP